MPRQRMAPGDYGKFTERFKDGKWFVTTYVRDSDGRRRRVERSSLKSAEDARRQLQRHLADRTAPLTGQLVTERTSLTELFEAWITAKAVEDGVAEQTAHQYRQVWNKHGNPKLGALRIRELPTSRANAHLQKLAAATPSQADHLRVVLAGMFSMAVRFDVIAVNPIVETKTAKTKRKPTRALTPDEFERVRSAVKQYTEGKPRTGGPKPGRLLPAFIEVLVATGCRPNEVLSLLWEEVDLLADPPTATVSGTMIDHDKIPGKPLHRQPFRKHHAPPHTVELPQFGVEALTQLLGLSGLDGPTGGVFTNRAGGWVSLANMRRSLRAALPDDLKWVTPHSFRRTVATVVRDEHGPAAAQRQMSHAKLSTTETHYLERQTRGPDVRATLDRFAGGGM